MKKHNFKVGDIVIVKSYVHTYSHLIGIIEEMRSEIYGDFYLIKAYTKRRKDTNFWITPNHLKYLYSLKSAKLKALLKD